MCVKNLVAALNVDKIVKNLHLIDVLDFFTNEVKLFLTDFSFYRILYNIFKSNAAAIGAKEKPKDE